MRLGIERELEPGLRMTLLLDGTIKLRQFDHRSPHPEQNVYLQIETLLKLADEVRLSRRKQIE